MKLMAISSRTAKEILRDPLNLFFGLGFPVILLLLLSAIQANVPVELFALNRLTPGIAVFGLSFMTLFAATLLSRDRESALLQRLYTTPLKASDFIFGYALPLLPMALVQTVICYGTALLLGLQPSWGILYAVAGTVPLAMFFIALGLLCGSVCTSKQVGGLCGALLTNLTAWLSGVWFDLELVGGVFEAAANVLPFTHGVQMGRALLAENIAGIFPHLWWILGYMLLSILLAVLLFLRQMKRQ